MLSRRGTTSSFLPSRVVGVRAMRSRQPAAACAVSLTVTPWPFPDIPTTSPSSGSPPS
jgi:hypothetical protein